MIGKVTPRCASGKYKVAEAHVILAWVSRPACETLLTQQI